MKVSQALFDNIVEAIRTDNTVAIVLTGSFARGDATEFSDIDLFHYVDTLPADVDKYAIRYEDDILISVSTATIESEQAKLQRPDTAIWAVEGVRQARLLFDPQGRFEALQQQAYDFVWTDELQAQANHLASRLLMDDGEEARKILTGLSKANNSIILYATYGLVLGLSKTIAIQQLLLLKSENEYFQRIREAIQSHTELAYHYDLAVGFSSVSVDNGNPVRMRGIALLRLYEYTADFLADTIQDEHRTTIEKTRLAIQSSPFVKQSIR